MKKYITKIDLIEIQNSCFVVMPFNSLYQIEYEKIIKPALEELNIESIRGDEIYKNQRIMDDIWLSIRSCRFLIAELSDRNPNVMYEVGLAHAIGKPVIIITRNNDDVPFDLRDIRYLYYDVSDPFWGQNLKLGLQSLIQKILDNPEIETYLRGISHAGEIEYPTIQEIADKEDNKPSLDISGIWQGSYFGQTVVDVVIHLTQKNNQLSGTGLMTYTFEEEVSVAQEILNGTIVDKAVNLFGVNYTFVKRGKSPYFGLDHFQFDIINDQEMNGNVFDTDFPGRKSSFKLRKQ